MRVQHHRLLMVLFCLAFGFGLLGISAPAAAADKKKAWASKKHKKTHHKASRPAAAAAGSSGGAAPAAEAEADDQADDESDAKDDKSDDAKEKPAKTKAASNDKASDKSGDDSSDDDDRRASRDKSDDDDDGGSTVVRRKAKRPVMEDEGPSGAPIALELEAGPRLVHRSFDFNDPLSNHVPGAAKPFGYQLGAAPSPFIDLGFYPAAFATRGLASGLGIIASYEKMIGTKSPDATGATVDTLAQQFEVGVRGRMPLAEHEVGLSATYGKQTFHLNETDPGPGTATVPNVDYTFVGLSADARLRFNPIEIGAHVGTREVLDTGTLNTKWFSTVKTQTISAGVSVAYRLTSMFDVVGGVDFMRYAFDFNPITMSTLVVGGAVDQYISGFLALRVSLGGS